MKNIIQIENLNFCYKIKPILKDVNLKIEKDEFLGIIGPNGGGKTTLLKLIMGMLKSHSGKIKILNKSPKEKRDSIGYVPQTYSLDKQFPITTLEIVLLGLLKHSKFGYFTKKQKLKAKNLLEKVGLKEFINSPFGKLSGGQAQRALIARALISDPQILILDEPTANIDPESEKSIFDILMNTNKKRTILMVSHDLNTILNRVKKIITVNVNVEIIDPKKICEHFSLGLYHTPILDGKK